MYIKTNPLIGLLTLLCLIATTAVADSAPIVGRIEDFDGNVASFEREVEEGPAVVVPAAYTVIRDQKLVVVGFLTELQAGDMIVVNDDKHTLSIKLADTLVKVTAANSPYLVVSKGEVPTLWGNFKDWVTRLTQRHQDEVMAVSISSKGGSNQPPFMPLLEVKTVGSTKVLVAGKRALSLTWKKGKPAYQLTLKQGDKTLFTQSVKEREFQLPELSFTPGDYQVSLSDNEQRQVEYSFTVVESLPTYPKELSADNLASLSASAWVTLQAMWLAEQEQGRWSLEAYQRVAEIAKEYHFARVLRDALGSGVVLKP
jgi:hypothetical protein